MAIYKVMSASGTRAKGALRNALAYCLQPIKTNPELCYIQGPYADGPIDSDSVYGSFLNIKNEYGKEEGRQYFHTVISFPKGEKISPEQALDFGIEFAAKQYPGYQCAMAVHTDKDHLHIHFIVNSVSYVDGKKFDLNRKKLKTDKEVCNDMCRNYGYSIAEKGKHADGTAFEAGEITVWNKDKYRALLNTDKPSYLVDCGKSVMNSIEKATDKQSFIDSMQQYGWNVQWTGSKKHITFISNEGRKIRDTNLAKTFNIDIGKEVLINEFERNKQKSRTIRTNPAARRSDSSVESKKSTVARRTFDGEKKKQKSARIY